MKIVAEFERDEYRIYDEKNGCFADEQLNTNYSIYIDHEILHEWAEENGYIKEKK